MYLRRQALETQMRYPLNMNANVFLLLACLIGVSPGSGLQVGQLESHDGREVIEGKRDIPEDEFDMSFMECTSEGCKLVKRSIKELPKPGPWEVESSHQSGHARSKRRMFMPDNRMRVRANSVGRFPFNGSVAIRVNGEVKCSGVALQHRFFLTAAHCVRPDGRRKVIEVGVLVNYAEMQWAKVETVRVHPVWKRGQATKKKLRLKDYKLQRLKDYAVLRTETPLDVSPMTIGYVGANAQGNEILKQNKTFMYFNAFDDERRPDNLNMRFCRMEIIKHWRIFSKCDSVPQTAGAGVYIRMRNKRNGHVERKVIAIATGDYGAKTQEYSVALRISARMFPHICYFVTESFNKCP